MTENNPNVFTNQNDGPVTMGFRWLFGQEANTVVLATMLAVLVYGGWRAATEAVPKTLKQIHDGYKEISADHTVAVEKITQNHQEEIEKLQQTFERTLDRIERKHEIAKAKGIQ